MKKTALILSIAIFMYGCTNDGKNQETNNNEVAAADSEKSDPNFYGEAFEYEQAVSVSELAAKSSSEDGDSVMVVTQGKVVEVCQKKGCWMTLALSNNETIRVTFKDYGFFVPKDLSGQVVLNGQLTYTETDVETLKHLAEDAGKSEEEINKITEPEKGYALIAYGVKTVD